MGDIPSSVVFLYVGDHGVRFVGWYQWDYDPVFVVDRTLLDRFCFGRLAFVVNTNSTMPRHGS